MYANEKRIFVSIDLPSFVKEELVRLSNPGIYWIKWMKPGNLHITLNFLGDLNNQQVEKAKEILGVTASQFQAFPIKLSQVAGERDMLWLEPENSEPILELQESIRNNLREEKIGKRERRDYRPHVLWAKSKTGRRMTWQPENYKVQEFIADKINLYESELTPGTATHTRIDSWPLQSINEN